MIGHAAAQGAGDHRADRRRGLDDAQPHHGAPIGVLVHGQQVAGEAPAEQGQKEEAEPQPPGSGFIPLAAPPWRPLAVAAGQEGGQQEDETGNHQPRGQVIVEAAEQESQALGLAPVEHRVEGLRGGRHVARGQRPAAGGQERRRRCECPRSASSLEHDRLGDPWQEPGEHRKETPMRRHARQSPLFHRLGLAVLLAFLALPVAAREEIDLTQCSSSTSWTPSPIPGPRRCPSIRAPWSTSSCPSSTASAPTTAAC